MNSFGKRLRSMAAGILAVMIAVSAAFTASAKDFDDVTDYREQIDMLSDIGIVVGTSENEFSPDENVTREQMAMLMFRTMLGRSDAGSENTTAFKDLYDDTYSGAISWASAAGIVIGTGDTTFEPTGGILMQDAMTMLVRALGQSTKSMDAGYPWTYIDAAVKLGLDDGLEKVGYGDTLTRAQTAAMIYNALTAEYLVPKTASGSYVLETTIIEYVFGYDIGEQTLSATNNFAFGGLNTVVRDGYVTLTAENGAAMTVPFEDLGLEGSADEWIGRTLRTITRTEGKNVRVFGATPVDSAAVYTEATISDNYVTIGGTKYRIVEKKSDTLATNDNELAVYCYGADGQLVQLKNAGELSAKLGIYELTLVTGGADGATAFVKPYTFGQFKIINGKYSIAGDLTEAQLTGGISNSGNAVSGDYVLYYFNAGNKSLEIKNVIAPLADAIVTRLNSTEAIIGGTTYKLGNSAAGVEASAVAAQLTVGKYASVVVYNGRLLAVVNPTVVVTEAKYLIATGETVPVYLDGSVRYAMTANIDGVSTSIITFNSKVSLNTVYRYTRDANGVYTLWAAGSDYFTVNGDLQLITTADENTTLSMGSAPYYTFGGMYFVTDKDTVIITRGDNGWSVKKGVTTSDIAINKGASFTAVFANNSGSVETLRFLFIDGAELGASDLTGSYVMILADNGTEYVDGVVCYVYTALDMSTGKTANYISKISGMTRGEIRMLSSTGEILTITGKSQTGTVTGYTASTVTIGEVTYGLTSDTAVIWLNSDNTTAPAYLNDLVGRTVEFMSNGSSMVTIIG